MLKRAVVLAVAVTTAIPVLSAVPASGRPAAAAADTIAVKAVEYNFDGLPTRVEKGETKFTFRNAGEKPHMLVLVKRRNSSNKKLKQLLEMSDKEVEKHIRFVGETFAGPGKSGKAIKADMSSGRYFALCFVSNGRKKPPHFAKGMLTKIDVK